MNIKVILALFIARALSFPRLANHGASAALLAQEA
jgi:hypothetical protein